MPIIKFSEGTEETSFPLSSCAACSAAPQIPGITCCWSMCLESALTALYKQLFLKKKNNYLNIKQCFLLKFIPVFRVSLSSS